MATNTKLDELKSQLYGLDTYTPLTEESARTQAESIYNPQYQQDLTSLRKTVEANVAQQGRSALSNGMQRSSYNQAAQASIRSGGLESEAQLAATKESNVASLIQQLLSDDKDRETEAGQYRNQLLMQLYDYENSGSSSSKTTTATNAANTVANKVLTALNNASSKLASGTNSIRNWFTTYEPHESVAENSELWNLLHGTTN